MNERSRLVLRSSGWTKYWMEITMVMMMLFMTSRVRSVTSDQLMMESCSDLSASLYNCTMPTNCTLGNIYSTTCTIVNDTIPCTGPRSFQKKMTCKYCWQMTENIHFSCNYAPPERRCQSGQDTLVVNCSANYDTICLGNRDFSKISQCNFSTGKTWGKSFVLSLFLSGVSGDRFYLGHFGWGAFKLFSFGGVGAWAIVDLVLISVGYLGPGDGSVFFM